MRSLCAAESIAIKVDAFAFRLLLACVCFLLAFARPINAFAGIVLPSLAPGSKYQLVFTTKAERDAFSSSMSTYNSFVQQQAALNPLLPTTIWTAVASTGAPAQNNAPVYADVPIYNTIGELVAANGNAFYSSTHTASMSYDQYGDQRWTQTWTGINDDGSPRDYLDAIRPSTTYGNGALLNGGWAYAGTTYNNVETRALFALSGQITAVPEPSTYAMAVAGLACGGFSMWRRRKRA